MEKVLSCFLAAFLTTVAWATASGNLIYYSTLDNEAAISTPSVGAAGQHVGGSFVAGKRGQALQVPAADDGVHVLLPPGTLDFQHGTIEFWGRIDKGQAYYQGQDPVFFMIYKGNSFAGADQLIHLEITSNGGLGNSGLFSAFLGGTCTTRWTWGGEF